MLERNRSNVNKMPELVSRMTGADGRLNKIREQMVLVYSDGTSFRLICAYRDHVIIEHQNDSEVADGTISYLDQDEWSIGCFSSVEEAMVDIDTFLDDCVEEAAA